MCEFTAISFMFLNHPYWKMLCLKSLNNLEFENAERITIFRGFFFYSFVKPDRIWNLFWSRISIELIKV